MDSNQILRHAHQVRDSCSGHRQMRRCSKSQMYLHQILHIISSVPRQESCVDPLIGGGGGLGIDLNLRLRSFPMEEDGESEVLEEKRGGPSACSFVGEVVPGDSTVATPFVGPDNVESSRGDCEVENQQGSDSQAVELNGDEALEHSEITNLQIQCSEIERNEIDERVIVAVDLEEEDKTEKVAETTPFGDVHSNDCFLGLLVEAARLISGNFSDDESEVKAARPSYRETKLRGELMTPRLSQPGKELVESERGRPERKLEKDRTATGVCRGLEAKKLCPIVRSKRGRSQTLPGRFRDSVLEPWRPQPLSNKVSRRQRRSR